MKIPFATGGPDCECGGEGILKCQTERTGRPVKVLCDCVKFMEATVERRGTMIAIGDPTIPVRQGTVVPKDSREQPGTLTVKEG